MIHNKQFNYMQLNIQEKQLIIEGSLSSKQLAEYDLHQSLQAFRPAKEQQIALIKAANQLECRIIVAREEQTIIGYVAILYPDPLESWSRGRLANLLELGAIEVAAEYRGYSVGKSLIKLAMMDDSIEDYIVISTEYYWHWDLKGAGLDIWKYRKMMERMMTACGFKVVTTDDFEINFHPANCLMARIGSRVSPEVIKQFDKLRFRKSLVK